MKACLAVATFALGALVRSRPPGIGELTLLVVPDEETGSVATRSLIETAARAADACFTLEAAREGGGIVTSRGAVGAMRVRATGRAQHVTDPPPHANALTALLRLVAPHRSARRASPSGSCAPGPPGSSSRGRESC